MILLFLFILIFNFLTLSSICFNDLLNITLNLFFSFSFICWVSFYSTFYHFSFRNLYVQIPIKIYLFFCQLFIKFQNVLNRIRESIDNEPPNSTWSYGFFNETHNEMAGHDRFLFEKFLDLFCIRSASLLLELDNIVTWKIFKFIVSN